MIKSFLFLMTTIFVAAQGGETDLGFAAAPGGGTHDLGDRRVIVVEDVHGTCLADNACTKAVYDVVNEFWPAGRRNLRGGASDEQERQLQYCPPSCSIVMTPVCVFMGCRRRRELFYDTFLSGGWTSETSFSTNTFVEQQDQEEFEHELESTCWGDVGIAADMFLDYKVKSALDGQFDLSAMSFRMQVYTCF